MAGFGRKGVTGDGRPNAGITPRIPQDAGLSPQARSFLASERERKQQEQGSVSGVSAAHDVFSSAIAAQAMAPQTQKRPAGRMGERTMTLAYVFWYFSGVAIAAHRWYLGSYRGAMMIMGLFWGGLAIGFAAAPVGVAMIGISVLWVIADAFLIPGMLRRYREQYA